MYSLAEMYSLADCFVGLSHNVKSSVTFNPLLVVATTGEFLSYESMEAMEAIEFREFWLS